MPGLSNIFNNGDNSDSSQESNLINNTSADADSALGLDATNSNSQSSVDDDGSSQSSSSNQTLGLDTDTAALTHSLTDAFNSSDSSDS